MKHKEQGFSLIEITLSVFVLSIGICSLLSIFPVAMRWGSKSIASNTGSLAARTALAYLEEDALGPPPPPPNGLNYQSTDPANPSDVPDGNYKIGDLANGGYYVTYAVNPGITGLKVYEVVFRVYRSDYTAFSVGTTQRNNIEKDLLNSFKTYIYDQQ